MKLPCHGGHSQTFRARQCAAGGFRDVRVLLLAMITSLWLASSDIRLSYRIAVAAAVVVFNVPNLSGAAWGKAVDIPTFLHDGLYRQYLTTGGSVLVLPYADTCDSMLWQAQSDMYFRMAGAWSGMPSAEFQLWPAMIALFNGAYLPDPKLSSRRS